VLKTSAEKSDLAAACMSFVWRNAGLGAILNVRLHLVARDESEGTARDVLPEFANG
jgi:hypothetical protein